MQIFSICFSFHLLLEENVGNVAALPLSCNVIKLLEAVNVFSLMGLSI